MFTQRTRPWARSSAAVVLALSALALAACGSDDESSGKPAAADAATTTSATGEPKSGTAAGSDEEAIEQLYVEYVDASYNGPASAICDAMTDRAKRQLKASGIAGDADCVTIFKSTLADHKTGNASYPKPEVRGVAVDGSRAVARIETGDGDLTRVRFSKDGREWKVDGGIDNGPR